MKNMGEEMSLNENRQTAETPTLRLWREKNKDILYGQVLNISSNNTL